MCDDEVCVQTRIGQNMEAPRSAGGFDLAFSENNPGLQFKDRTKDSSSDLKEVFLTATTEEVIGTEAVSRARFLCAKYLGGAWTQVQLHQFKIRPITGGLSNLLFLVELPPGMEPEGVEPKAAVLRIQCQTDLDQLLSESVVFTLLSERSLGPRLLGVFPGGRFEQYIPSRPLQCSEISQPQFSRMIAPMLARVHVLDVPVNKEPEILNCMRQWLAKFRQTAAGQCSIDIKCTVANIPSDMFPASITVDELEREFDFIEHFMKNVDSPIVFSHNDLQEGNILLYADHTIDPDGKVESSGPSKVQEPLVLIDFEYCNYNYRGFDLGNHFCEYGYDYYCDEAPYYKIHQDQFEKSAARRIFCEAYVDEYIKLRSEQGSSEEINKEKEISRLELEGRLFMPISNLFWVGWSLLNAEESNLPFGYGDYARDRLAMYFYQKPQLEEYLENKGL